MTSTFDVPVVTRRSLLLGGAIAGVAVAIGGDPARSASSGSAGALVPEPVVPGLLSAMRTRSIVALGEYHGVQDFHDVLQALLRHPDLPGQIQDIVVEFGSSRYQGLVDQFVLDRVPVPRGELAQVWRQLADMAWNAPVYEQFFRTVRSVNWMLPADRRIRVLLGQPTVTMMICSRIRTIALP
jgi:hypothetical protein